jgi:hypothetical protein
MTQVLREMYITNDLDMESVSVHSAFICLLHLANENNLMFEQQGFDGALRE